MGLRLLKNTADKIPDNGLEVEIVQLVGFPAEAIVQMATKEGYDTFEIRRLFQRVGYNELIWISLPLFIFALIGVSNIKSSVLINFL